jgi:hypothetical protein
MLSQEPTTDAASNTGFGTTALGGAAIGKLVAAVNLYCEHTVKA